MPQWITLAILGGLGYWFLAKPASAATTVVEQKYDKPIGPGLTGVTNVARVRVVETADLPMGTFAKGKW